MQDSKCSTEKSYCNFCMCNGEILFETWKMRKNITLLAWEILAPKIRIKCLDLAKTSKVSRKTLEISTGPKKLSAFASFHLCIVPLLSPCTSTALD